MEHQSQSTLGLGFVALAAVLLLVSLTLPAAANENLRLALALSLLSLIGLGVGLGLGPRTGLAGRQTLLWAAAIVSAATGLSYFSELRHLVLPATDRQITASARSQAGPAEAGSVTLRAESSGHFFATALVNGTAVEFLVDTGATDVALAPDDAVRLGIDLNNLTYDIPIMTANGQTRAAETELDEIVIGDIRIDHVTVTIPRQGALGQSLLGMGFLKRLSSFSVDSDRLVMHQ